MTKEGSNHFRRFTETEEIRERHKHRDDSSYEDRMVSFVLQRFGLQKAVKRLLDEQYRVQGGERVLRFRFFNELYPSFPLLLGAQRLEKLHLDPKMLLPALFKYFPESPIVSAYERFFEEAHHVAQGRAIGLVFPRKGIMRGLIIHNAADLDERCFHGLSLVYHGGTKKHRLKLFVQSFQQLIETLHNKGHGWQP